MRDADEITQVLELARQGDDAAESQVFELLYAELRRATGQYGVPEPTLQTTALVHEAYGRLSADRGTEWQDRRAFLADSAQVMRNVLVDAARRQQISHRATESTTEVESASPSRRWADRVIDLDAALNRLASIDERQARLAELRYFAGLTRTQAGAVLGIDATEARSGWRGARDWLHLEMRGGFVDEPSTLMTTAPGVLLSPDVLLRWADVPVFSAGEVLLERFEIVRLIGRGGMGEVYEAFDSMFAQPVAIKTIRFPMRTDAEITERFRSEVQQARRVSHPNVCRVYELYSAAVRGSRPVPFFTMELVEGETLRDRIRRMGPLPVADALELAKQICAGLEEAHRSGLVHRDLKSGNIILTTAGDGSMRVKITDFGLAHAVGSLQERGDPARESVLAGTLLYMAPELLERRRGDERSDIYALGVILYQAVTGRNPFEVDESSVSAAVALRKAVPSPRKYAPRLPATWERTILSCLAFDPRERPHSAERIAEMLAAPPSFWERALTLFASAHAPESRSSRRATCQWKVTIDADANRITAAEMEHVVEELRKLARDEDLVIRKIEPGSVVLVLEGDDEGYRILKNLFSSGDLPAVYGLRVQDVSLLDDRDRPKQDGGEPSGCGLFLSYSHQDSKWRTRLCTHFAVMQYQGLIHTWHDRKIKGGELWEKDIDAHLEAARIILLLVSPDFLGSAYCYGVELKKALDRHNRRQARVIPVIVRPADWKNSPVGQLQALPPDGKPLSEWKNRDRAMNLITTELREIIANIRGLSTQQ